MTFTNKNELKIAIIYVLFNPDLILLSNSIKFSIGQVERIYLIDNSDYPCENIDSLLNDSKITYIKLPGNYGIAYALNRGCNQAMKDGFNWVVTFDQDSLPPIDLIENYIVFLNKVNHQNDIGLLTLQINQSLNILKEEKLSNEMYTAITSGSCMDLKAYINIGGFKDELFIDAVDHEYCLNLRVHKYRIIRLNNLTLKHKFGDDDRILRLFNIYICGIHSRTPLRYYYMVRNYLYVSKKYAYFDSELCVKLRIELFKTLIKMLILEKNKLKKLRASVLGFIDYKRNKLGKYSY